MPRPLEGPELVAYAPVCPPELACRARVAVVPWLPAGAGGMTLRRLILVREDGDRTGGRRLLAHELVHVRQWKEHGTIGFLRRYVGAYLANLFRLRNHRAAYLAIPFEQEARTIALAWATARAAEASGDQG